ncbi:MAG: Hsp20/alpha crystallin family protein [Actinomycetota bacterium]
MSTQELTGHEPALDHPIQMVGHAEKNRYVVRLELPDSGPGTDIEVSVDAQVLTVRAERPARPAGNGHPELRHGRFSGQVTLPAAVDDRDVAATYGGGILEISAGWQDGPTARRIKVLPLSDVR